MLRIIQLEVLERKLSNVCELVQVYSERDLSFPDRVEAWCVEIETELQNNRLPAASTVAALKSTLISVQDGAFPSNITITGQSTRRKRQRLMAAEALRQVVEVVQNAIQNDRARLGEAEQVATHLVAVARANGMLVDENAVLDWKPKDVRALIAVLRSTKSTLQGIVQLEGLAGPEDAVIVLHRMLAFGRQRSKSLN